MWGLGKKSKNASPRGEDAEKKNKKDRDVVPEPLFLNDKNEEQDMMKKFKAKVKRSTGGGASLALRVSKCPNSSLALTNCVFLHPDDAKTLTPTGETYTPESNYLLLKNFVYSFR